MMMRGLFFPDLAFKIGRAKQPPKVKFTPEEDAALTKIINEIGTHDWVAVAKQMKTRNPRQCRERWNNYLKPDLVSAPWTPEEDALLEEKYSQYGAGWNTIAKFFQGRSDNSLRNRYMKLYRAKMKKEKKLLKQKNEKNHSPVTNINTSVEQNDYAQLQYTQQQQLQNMSKEYAAMNIPTPFSYQQTTCVQNTNDDPISHIPSIFDTDAQLKNIDFFGDDVFQDL